MSFPPARTLRYLRTWLAGDGPVETREVTLRRGSESLPASWTLPTGAREPVGAWIVLHGLTRSGRDHVQLVRFTRALAASGSAVLVPEVPEWRALHLAPKATAPTIRAALDWLEEAPEVEGTRRALVGFSFGAPQAIVASARPELRDRVAGVVAFGGYCDLERTVRFQLTGEHEWKGVTRWHRPDPYGRWIVAGNHLTGVPGFRDHEDVAAALLELARTAGDASLPSWDPSLDHLKEHLRRELDRDHRAAFDLMAPVGGGELEPDRGAELARSITEAALQANPEMEVRNRLGNVPGPVHLVHGRNDHIIPFTEGLRLGRELPGSAAARLTVTALFGHSDQDPFPWARGVQESAAFFRALTRLLGLV